MMELSRKNSVFVQLIACLLALNFCPMAVNAETEAKDSVGGILAVQVEHSSPIVSLTEGAWTNPALTAERYEHSLSQIAVSYVGASSERYGRFEATTYLKRGRLTLQAVAGYDNGALFNLTKCENADPEIVYPYWTYDTIGGNQNLERYEFGGSVGVSLGKGWSVGANGHYLAGLYYRNRDPRPRNVSGIFNIGIGGSRRVGNYTIGVSASYRRYKQTCEIDFKSELGAATIYHLTGLGTHYARFAGLGEDSYYHGNQWGLSATLLPDSAGFYLHIDGKTEKIVHVLTDLNKLPMANIRNKKAEAALGYRSTEWGVILYGEAERRHGYENIFGDAISNQYPQIGSLLMHIVNWQTVGLRGAWRKGVRRVTISVTANAAYSHFKEQHREPYLKAGGKSWHFGAEVLSMWQPKKHIIIKTEAGYGRQTYDNANLAHLLAGCDYALKSGKYSIGLTAEWTRNFENQFMAALSFGF